MAQVKAHEADRALARLDPGISLLLVYGPDQGLVGERAEGAARAFVGDKADALQIVKLDGSDLASDPLKLADEAHAAGLFGGRRAVRFAAPSRPVTAAVQLVLATPPRDCLIVIEAGDLPKSHALRTIVEKSASGLAVPCFVDQLRGIESLIDQVLGASGLSIDRASRSVLAGRLGADRALSRRELEKLALYVGAGPAVTAEDVMAVVGDAAARSVDDIVDGAFAGGVARLDLAFLKLRQEGGDPGVLLGYALRHGLALLAARHEMESSGQQASAMADKMRINFLRKSAVTTALERSSAAQLTRVVAMLESAVLQTRLNPALADPIAARALWNIAAR